jgi:3-phosphoglycerate kinase
MQYLSRIEPEKLRGKICLLRVDFNIENETENFRLIATLPTIHHLIGSGANIVLLSHRGRPKKTTKSRKENSLQIVIPFLEKNIGAKLTLIPRLPSHALIKKIRSAPNGSVFLFENLRFFDAETENSSVFAQKLADMGDFYVNDAFAASHRSHASIEALPRLLPSYAGLLLEREITVLSRLKKLHAHPFVMIVGGAKALDKVRVIKKFLPRISSCIVGGVPANTLLKARGFDIQKSVYEPELIAEVKNLLSDRKIILPSDFTWEDGRIVDIGPQSTETFERIIGEAKAILWNGPMGLFENESFAHGSIAIANAVAEANAFTVAGGGETSQLLTSLNLNDRISFLSTGGGAMLEYLSGNKLPGLAALEKSRKLS